MDIRVQVPTKKRLVLDDEISFRINADHKEDLAKKARTLGYLNTSDLLREILASFLGAANDQ